MEPKDRSTGGKGKEISREEQRRGQMATQLGHPPNRRGETEPHPHNVAGRMDHETIFVHQISQECVCTFSQWMEAVSPGKHPE